MMKRILFTYIFIFLSLFVFAQQEVLLQSQFSQVQKPATANVTINGGSTALLIENQTFDYSRLSSTFRAIDIQNYTGAITIRNCKFYNYKGSNQSYTIFLFNVTNVTISNCWFENTCLAIRVQSPTTAPTVTNLQITNCKFKDIDQTGNPATASGSSAIQLVSVSGTNINISGNRVYNTRGLAGDVYSFINSSGTVGSVAQFTNNWAKMNYDAQSSMTTNQTGGGIVFEGTGGTQYWNVVGNIIDSATAWGMQIIQNANNITFTNNQWYTRLRNDANGRSAGGIQVEPNLANTAFTWSGNVVMGTRWDGVPNDFFAPNFSFTATQLSVRPIWLILIDANGGNLLSTFFL